MKDKKKNQAAEASKPRRTVVQVWKPSTPAKMAANRLHCPLRKIRLAKLSRDRTIEMKISFAPVIAAFLLLSLAPSTLAQQIDTKQLGEMRWRNIGPHRGGRTRALSGVPSRPNVFYLGAVNGGAWKSTDYGRTWEPIFDSQPTGS